MRDPTASGGLSNLEVFRGGHGGQAFNVDLQVHVAGRNRDGGPPTACVDIVLNSRETTTARATGIAAVLSHDAHGTLLLIGSQREEPHLAGAEIGRSKQPISLSQYLCYPHTLR